MGKSDPCARKKRQAAKTACDCKQMWHSADKTFKVTIINSLKGVKKP